MILIKVEDFEVEITRKRVRNLNMRVLPPQGRVVVSVPLTMSIKSATQFISSKRDWIIKQKKKIESGVFDKEKEFIPGETHFLFGNQYTMLLVRSEGKEGILLKKDTIYLYIRDINDRNRKQKVVDQWYRKNLNEIIPALIIKWEKVIGVKVNEVRIRKMRTRWGTCNPKAGRIWINLELAKMPPYLLEYIIVHELTHLIELSHNKRFRSLMDQFLPNWRTLRKELNKKSI
ncbi:MAG: M48 family metallopeptidase [Bacteroidales bacterium]|nr:M48 family metallopeptidase [Bacteroidales bacterium]